ncbi:PREDICTED: ERI1 exoribonuclease 2 [Sturnus vulgaris]|uniref:ERI1 exoribonuclease 2 n=1 Tax=Sturnus vulgaris TaxID=9172 RepID=UPI00071A530A|nr:PREDICTED: ERI1 exoribonuclease 2 [Sturnus vulgaris]
MPQRRSAGPSRPGTAPRCPVGGSRIALGGAGAAAGAAERRERDGGGPAGALKWRPLAEAAEGGYGHQRWRAVPELGPCPCPVAVSRSGGGRSLSSVRVRVPCPVSRSGGGRSLSAVRVRRRLGLARSSARARSGARAAAGQRFGFLIVLDFEATCWGDRGQRGPEIIEFPAVLLNTSTGVIESEFHMYVQPQEHPILSEFCTELTGITQNQVDEGVPLNICLSQFLKWIQKIQKEKKIIFSTDSQSNCTSEAKACAFVTWTDWDLGVCLHYECKRKQLHKPDILNSWIDLKATYRAFYNRKPKGLNGALQDLGIVFEGREHSGLDDSRNTARLAWRLICDGCVLKITKSLDKAHQKSNLISRTLTVNITDKTPLGSSSRPETSRDGTRETKSLAENKHNNIAGNKISSNVQAGEQQITCTDPSADVCVVPSSSSRTEFHAQSHSSSAASTDRFPVPLGLAKPPPSPAAAGIQQGLSIGQPLRTTRPSLPVQGSGLVLVSTTIPSVTLSSGDISTSSECLSLLTDWEDVALIPESQYEQNSDSVQLKDDSSTDSLTVFEEETISKQLAVTSSDNQSLEESAAPMELVRSVVYKSPDTTIYNIGTVQRQTSKFSAFKLPSAKGNAVSAQSALIENYSRPLEAPKRKPTSPKTCPPAKKQSFHIFKEKASSFYHSLPLRSSNLPKVSPAVLKSAVNLNESVRAMRSGKSTPPLCNCGRRAKKLSVSNAGPNQGRAFFCCPVGKQGGDKKSCGYFKWECALLKEKSNGLTFNADALTSLGAVSSNTENSSYKKYLCLRPSMRT